MRMEFRPEESRDAPSSQGVQRRPKLQPVPGKILRPSEPPVRADSHELQPEAREPRPYQAAQAELHPSARVHTADEYVLREVRASREPCGKSIDAEETKLENAESKVDDKIRQAASRGDLSELRKLEVRKAAIGDEELLLAQEKIQRQREAAFIEAQKKIAKSRERELCAQIKLRKAHDLKLQEQRDVKHHQTNAKAAEKADKRRILAEILAEQVALWNRSREPVVCFSRRVPRQRGIACHG